jgi:hypothetical protein
MTKYRYAHTNTERHPYIKIGWYWKVFEDLFKKENLSPAYRARMLKLKEKDAKAAGKKFAG